ncbi:MAG: D-2-hydroxyacid dehydrogenase [Sphaerobacteraceae bacterium]|nr:MAG: D-2-hydroxyacid dehydrogenase [Sphaerobacteraceae bacterium]
MKLVVANGWDPEGLEDVKKSFPNIEWVDGKTPEAMNEHIVDAEVVYGHVNSEHMKVAKNLKWVHSHSAGVDWVLRVPELIESDVVVTNTTGGHADTISEHTIGMLISLTRGFPHLARAQGEKRWAQPLEFKPIGLSGRTMGVIGLGNIGSAIARVASAMQMKVIAVDARKLDNPNYVERCDGLDKMPQLLQESDVVVVTVPFTPQTKDMINAAEINQMKDSSYLIGISRGGIINEEALAAALKSGKLAGAAVDVTAVEPLPSDDPLWEAPNLIITPHCCGTSEQTFREVTEFLRTNLNKYLAGEELVNAIDKRAGF